VDVLVGVTEGVAVGVAVLVEVGVIVGVWVGVLVAVTVAVAVGVAVSVEVGVIVGVWVGVLVAVTVAVAVGVGARIATVIVLLPETESSNSGDVCTVPLKSTRAVATRTPLFTLIRHPIDGTNVWLVSEGDEKPDATVIGFVKSGVPSDAGQ
jgi:hypothetical protein